MKNHVPAQAVYQQQDLHLNQAWYNFHIWHYVQEYLPFHHLQG